jgi:transcriptional regulator with XRE-family HTH domain
MIIIKKREFCEKMARMGMTQSELAKKAGLYQSYISMIVSGKRFIRATTAKKISEALECNFDEIFKFVERG